ncbi:MAG TPA: HPP family protein [Verrucomicrobiae bacterium]|nr:HPP family protein [Verrucomicrobiae bacterium]
MALKTHVLATIGEGGLILTVGGVGWAAHMPLLFASLGPTAYELVEKPNTPSAKAYNIIVGHFIALGAGFFALWALHAWNSPKVTVAELVSSRRLWAALLAVVITTAATLALKASQPASLSTSLLVSLGSMQTGRGALAIIIGVLLLAALGKPLRRYFQPLKPEKSSGSS